MKNIRAARKHSKKTLAQVAEQTGVSVSYLSDLECGRANNPSLAVLEKLAQCYDTTIIELLDEQIEEAIHAVTKRKIDDQQNWYRLHQRYYSTSHICGESGREHEAIDKAIERGLCICSGQALCACRIVQVVTTIVERSPDQYGYPRSSVYVTVIAEPMIPPQGEN